MSLKMLLHEKVCLNAFILTLISYFGNKIEYKMSEIYIGNWSVQQEVSVWLIVFLLISPKLFGVFWNHDE